MIIFTLLKVAMTHEFNPDPTIGLNYLPTYFQMFRILEYYFRLMLLFYSPKGTRVLAEKYYFGTVVLLS